MASFSALAHTSGLYPEGTRSTRDALKGDVPLAELRGADTAARQRLVQRRALGLVAHAGAAARLAW